MKQDKPYKTTIKNGQLTLTLNAKIQGRQVSIVSVYPSYARVKNEDTGEMENKRLTKSQLENQLYGILEKQIVLGE